MISVMFLQVRFITARRKLLKTQSNITLETASDTSTVTRLQTRAALNIPLNIQQAVRDAGTAHCG